MSKFAHAGRKGKDVRSDCYVELEIGSTSTLDIEIKSKVLAAKGLA